MKTLNGMYVQFRLYAFVMNFVFIRFSRTAFCSAEKLMWVIP